MHLGLILSLHTHSDAGKGEPNCCIFHWVECALVPDLLKIESVRLSEPGKPSSILG